jgi:hypothetical protein
MGLEGALAEAVREGQAGDWASGWWAVVDGVMVLAAMKGAESLGMPRMTWSTKCGKKEESGCKHAGRRLAGQLLLQVLLCSGQVVQLCPDWAATRTS